MLISAELDRDNSGINFVLRASGDARRRLEGAARDRSALRPTPSPSRRATRPGGQILADLTSRGINLVANAAAQSADHIRSYFTMLRAELGFYVSCLNLADRLAAKGVPISVPEPAAAVTARVLLHRPARCLPGAAVSRTRSSATTCRPTGSRWSSSPAPTPAGKSTFLRSVGVAQLMMQCGLFVTAGSYRANVTRGIFTHFIREEDAGMTSGRLDEELRRMSAIADQIGPHCLMLFNESFAGTNEREGSEIGRQVVRALLDAGITVFFVTHRFGFAEHFHRQQARLHPVPAGRAPARRAPRLQARRAKTRSRPASGKTSTTGSAAGSRRA